MGVSFSGLASGMDTQSIVNDIMKAQRARVEKVQKDKTKFEWKKDAWSDMNKTLFSFYKTELFEFKSSSTYGSKKLNSSNSSVVEIKDSPEAINGFHKVEIKNMAKGSHLTSDKIEKDSLDINKDTKISELTNFSDGEVKTLSLSLDGGASSMEVSITEEDTIGTLTEKLQKLDLEASVSFDENYDRFFISSKKTGKNIQVGISSSDEDLLNAIGFSGGNLVGSSGEDAKFIYNGEEFTSDKNDVTINGLKMNILADTGSSNISVSQDTEKIYEKVKKFVSKYNEIIKTLDDKYSAQSSKGYEPLTADQKAAMSEKDVEAWEKRIKDSLFKRDGKIYEIRNTIRSTVSSNAGVDTSEFEFSSLSELGIVTGKWQEKGTLHIEGDKDDFAYGTKKNKLKEAIENKPEKVKELLTAIGNKLYDKLGKMMKSTTSSSALTFYNDKQMSKDLVKYEKRIFDMEKKMAKVEQRYYKQFAAMEKAIQKSNSTGAWLTQQLSAI